MSKRISIINFKGGVGKTTLAFHLATGLARFHDARALLVDVDHQSSLSVVCLGAERWAEMAEGNRTTNEVFLSYLSEGGKMPGAELIAPCYDDGMVEIAPARLALDTTEIELTSTYQANPVRGEWNKRTLICRWIEEAGLDDAYDYIIFDCPPATKIVSQNAIAASHGYIVPVVPEAVMLRGLPFLMGTVSQIDRTLMAYSVLSERERRGRAIWAPDTKLAGIAVSWVRGHRGERGTTLDHARNLTDLEEFIGREIGVDYLLDPYIPYTTLVSRAMGDNMPVYDLPTSTLDDNMLRVRETDDEEETIAFFYEELVDKIKVRIDSL